MPQWSSPVPESTMGIGSANGGLVPAVPRPREPIEGLAKTSGARAAQDRSIEFGRAPSIGHMPHTGPIWLAVRGRTTSLGPLASLGLLQGKAGPHRTQARDARN